MSAFWRRLALSFTLALLGLSSGWAQNRLMVPDPYGSGNRLMVYDLDESRCLVDSGYGAEYLAAKYFYFDESEAFAEGYVELNRPRGYVMEGKRKKHFEFEAKVRASRDYKDCFVVLQLYTLDGREFLLPYEIDDLKANKVQRVRINAELGVEINRGMYSYHFFSEGEEIYYALTQRQLGRRHPGPIALGVSGSRDPELDQLPEAELPRELAPVVSGNEALIAVGVNDGGFSVDHLVLSASDPAVEKVAIDLVKRARFKPAADHGIFVRKDMLLRVVFDSRGQYQLWAEN